MADDPINELGLVATIIHETGLIGRHTRRVRPALPDYHESIREDTRPVCTVKQKMGRQTPFGSWTSGENWRRNLDSVPAGEKTWGNPGRSGRSSDSAIVQLALVQWDAKPTATLRVDQIKARGIR